MPQLRMLIKSMIFKQLFSKRGISERPVYEAIVAAARHPIPYGDWGIPDTIDGRFDMTVLHLFLVLDRLKGEDEKFRQVLTDTFFGDMDRSLREWGVGDLSVGKKVRKMAEACYGRLRAYDQAVPAGTAAVAPILARNFFPDGGGEAAVEKLAQYVVECRQLLLDQAPAAIMAGDLRFPEPVP